MNYTGPTNNGAPVSNVITFANCSGCSGTAGAAGCPTHSRDGFARRSPFRCPACDGYGVRTQRFAWSTSGDPTEPCRSCDGTGIIWN